MIRKPLIQLILGGLGLCNLIDAQSVIHEKGADMSESPKSLLVLPYLFHSESMETGGGVGVATQGYGQEHAAFLFTAFASENGSLGGVFVDRNIQIPGVPRLFIDSTATFGYYGRIKSFTAGNSNYPGERAGSNDSSPENFITSPGIDEWGEVEFKFLLPIGHGRNEVVHHYVVDKGILHANPSGASSWNPLKSGRTRFSLKPFYRRQSLEDTTYPRDITTIGLELRLRRDNTDFILNPSRGSIQRLSLLRDTGSFGSDTSWTRVEGEVSKFFSLGQNNWARQQVIALNAYASDTPTWSETNRPPSFMASRLGGYFRMRGYPTDRFWGKSAIYYSAEYRFIPDWNPTDESELLEPAQIDWWQFSLFAETGKVSDTFNARELHSKMRWDVGIGIRAMAKHLVLRADTAWSNEGWEIQLMVGQPF